MAAYSVERRVQEGLNVIVLRDPGSGSIAEMVPGIGNNLFRFESRGRPVLEPPESLSTFREDPVAAFKYGTSL